MQDLGKNPKKLEKLGVLTLNKDDTMVAEQHYKTIDDRCDPQLTYNFTLTGGNATVGLLKKFSFPNAGKDLVADTSVPNPMSPDEKIKIIGALDFVAWDGGPTDPITFTFRVSPANKAILQEALTSPNGGVEVDYEVLALKYCYATKTYFPYFHTDEKVIKSVITKGTKITINNEPDRVIQQPLNFQVSCSLTAKSEGAEQEFCIAFTKDAPFARRVGVTDS